MAHKSDNVSTLTERKLTRLKANPKEPNVEFLRLPFYEYLEQIDGNKLGKDLNEFLLAMNEQSAAVVLTSPIAANVLCSQIPNTLHVKLWIAVKLDPMIVYPGELTQHHAALLVLTRYTGSLKHTKTRIAYSYCPECDKTTKDYGGKKHLYDPYGTLMSDVWRDISVDTNANPKAVIDRVKDLFGLPIYKAINIYNLIKAYPPLNNQRTFKEYENVTVNEFSYNDRTGSQLINDDCLEALAQIPENSIDFCFADPPYNINKKYEGWNDGIDIQNYFVWCDRWLTAMARALKPGRTLAVLNIPQWCIRHFKHLNTILDYQDWIVWEGLSLPVRMIMPAHYSILCFTKGHSIDLPGLTRNEHTIPESIALKSLKENYCVRSSCIKRRKAKRIDDTTPITNLWWDVHRLKHNSRRVDHPCQLPPAFMYRLISLFTNQGDYVLDPFNGAGTTTLTAAQLNRNYVGIELTEKYHQIALKRHQELAQGLDPFRKTNDIPKAKNSNVTRLRPQKYDVPKKILQLEVKDIGQQLGRVPTREDVMRLSRHPIEYFDNYFINWGEVTAAVRVSGMTENRPTNQTFDLFTQANDFGDTNSSQRL